MEETKIICTAIPVANDMPCATALLNPERVSRAHYVCPVCKMDVSMHVICMADADFYDAELTQ